MPISKKNLKKTTTKIVNCQIQYTQHENDCLEDIVRRLTNWFNFESQQLIDDLPHLGAVIEFWELVTAVYDTDTSEGAIELIRSGDESPAPWNEFVLKHGLKWVKFKNTIVGGVKVAEPY